MGRRLAVVAAAVIAILAVVPALAAPQPHAHSESAVFDVIGRIDRSLRTTRYVHATHVDETAGRFDFDCSGMATWVLARSAPTAHDAVMRRNGRRRPVASDYHDVITQAPTSSAPAGWLRVAHARDLKPGDLIAWRRPQPIVSSNTGHVLFVVAAPQQVDAEGRRFLVRVADATSIPHGDDTRPQRHASGFGYGTIALFLDRPDGEVIGYGWQGLATRLDFRTPIALGRAVQ
jgi:hypothetical protein